MSDNAVRTVGWIGLGHMGAPMAANLVLAGHRVQGFDLSPSARDAAAEAGIIIVGSAAEAARGADLVVTMLQHGDQVSACLFDPATGALSTATPGTLVIDSSTIDLQASRDLHTRVADAGFAFLDAPVSGGVPGAAAGTLTFMVGGAADALERARPYLEVMGSRVFHTGGPGNGQAAKIANNLMLGITLAATCEGVVLAQRLGLDPQVFHDLATVSSGDNWALRTWFPVPGVVPTAPVNRDFEGGFAAALMAKDLGLALAAAEDTDTPLECGSLVAHLLQRVVAAGAGGLDSSVLVRLVDGSLGEA